MQFCASTAQSPTQNRAITRAKTKINFALSSRIVLNTTHIHHALDVLKCSLARPARFPGSFRFNEALILKKFVADALLFLLVLYLRREGGAAAGSRRAFPVNVADRLLKFPLRCPISEMDCSDLVWRREIFLAGVKNGKIKNKK